MKVAYCIYGQPRRFEEGHAIIMKLLSKNPSVCVDFFYHTWHSEPKEGEKTYYVASGHRSIQPHHLMIQQGTIEKLNELYKPKDYKVDAPRTFDVGLVEPSLLFDNTSNRQNIPNILSYFYSNQMVRDVLSNWISATGTEYDLVITSRFDQLLEADIDLTTLDRTKMYTSYISRPRMYITGHFQISNVEVYLNTFNVFNNLPNIKDNKSLLEYMKRCGLIPCVNGEELLTTNYIYYYNNFDNVVLSDSIPNFTL